MNHEFVTAPKVDQPQIIATEHLAPPNHDPIAVDPVQAQAVDELFARKKENDTVAGIVTLYTGALVLHDMAKEAFSEPVALDPPAREKKPKEG